MSKISKKIQKTPKIFLGPMDGLTDAPLRYMLTKLNNFDLTFTEFIRVTNTLINKSAFYKYIPEIRNDSLVNNVEVRPQILGSDPVCMSENALKLIELGAKGVDINFGCPAKTVNKSNGGAVLLKNPENLYNITSRIKNSIPDSKLSAKIRLGYNDTNFFLENLHALESSKVDFITVHARTKKDAYTPPAKWEIVGEVFEKIKTPIIINGDIVCEKSYKDAIEKSKCNDVMIGRGAFINPNIVNKIRFNKKNLQWNSIVDILDKSSKLIEQHYSVTSNISASRRDAVNRIKQWTGKYLCQTYSDASKVFEKIKRLEELDDVKLVLQESKCDI